MQRKLKDRTCVNPACDTIFSPRNGFHTTCSISCAQEYARHKTDKRKKKAWAQEKREWKIDNDRPHQDKLTQQVFNRVRVLQEKIWYKSRGLEPVCISCGRPNMDWCAGHFKTRGAFPELRFDHANVFLQCNKRCNESLSGNIYGDRHSHGYHKGLMLRFGDDLGQEIIDYLESPHDPIKMTGRELYEFRLLLSRQERELKRELESVGSLGMF